MSSATRRPAAAPRARSSAVAGRADFDRRVLGSFLEHLGRAIYTGVYRARLARSPTRKGSAPTSRAR